MPVGQFGATEPWVWSAKMVKVTTPATDIGCSSTAPETPAGVARAAMTYAATRATISVQPA
jgi:hypothetical protein